MTIAAPVHEGDGLSTPKGARTSTTFGPVEIHPRSGSSLATLRFLLDYLEMPRNVHPPQPRARSIVHGGAWETAYREMAGQDQSGRLAGGDALEAFAQAAYMSGHEDAYIDLMSRAFDAFLGNGKPLRAARAAFWIGLTLMFRTDHGRGGGWLARAAHLIDAQGGDCLEAGYIMLPPIERDLASGNNQAAERAALEAQAIGERFDDADLSEIARHLVGRARLERGDVQAGISALDETMIATTEGRLSPIVTGLLYCSVIEACQRHQIFRRAGEWTAALSSWCARQPELVAFTGRCLIHRSEILLFEGHWPEAEAEADAAIRRIADGPSEHHAGPAYYQKGELQRLRGDFAAAEESYRNATALGFDPQPGLALLRLRQGRIALADAAIRRALAAAGNPILRMRLLGPAAEIALAAGDPEAAENLCRELREVAGTYSTSAIDATVAETSGDLHFASSEAEAALRAYGAAAGIWRDMRNPLRHARVRLKIAHACLALGDAEGGASQARAALDCFAALGAGPDRREAETLLRRLDPQRPAILTARQTEVLTHIAEGLTNREIAGRLGLSERTVDRHVSDILTRIDVPTRAAAVARAISTGLIPTRTSG